MNKVKIPDEFNTKDVSFFLNKLMKNNSQFFIPKNIIDFVRNIDNRGDRQITLYVLYKIITDLKLSIDITPIPVNGLSFKNYNNNESLCVYHCHLNAQKVLIWYVNKNDNQLNIDIKYIDHPDDNYKSILNDIYKNSNGYNTITNQYFKDCKNNTYLKDNFIFKWKDFIKKYINEF